MGATDIVAPTIEEKKRDLSHPAGDYPPINGYPVAFPSGRLSPVHRAPYGSDGRRSRFHSVFTIAGHSIVKDHR